MAITKEDSDANADSDTETETEAEAEIETEASAFSKPAMLPATSVSPLLMTMMTQSSHDMSAMRVHPEPKFSYEVDNVYPELPDSEHYTPLAARPINSLTTYFIARANTLAADPERVLLGVIVLYQQEKEKKRGAQKRGMITIKVQLPNDEYTELVVDYRVLAQKSFSNKHHLLHYDRGTYAVASSGGIAAVMFGHTDTAQVALATHFTRSELVAVSKESSSHTSTEATRQLPLVLSSGQSRPGTTTFMIYAHRDANARLVGVHIKSDMIEIFGEWQRPVDPDRHILRIFPKSLHSFEERKKNQVKFSRKRYAKGRNFTENVIGLPSVDKLTKQRKHFCTEKSSAKDIKEAMSSNFDDSVNDDDEGYEFYPDDPDDTVHVQHSSTEDLTRANICYPNNTKTLILNSDSRHGGNSSKSSIHDDASLLTGLATATPVRTAVASNINHQLILHGGAPLSASISTSSINTSGGIFGCGSAVFHQLTGSNVALQSTSMSFPQGKSTGETSPPHSVSSAGDISRSWTHLDMRIPPSVCLPSLSQHTVTDVVNGNV